MAEKAGGGMGDGKQRGEGRQRREGEMGGRQ